ncbi:vegetative incompatibility protein HET-E-1 [Colletotrichum spaethianum]|uniref:Vegetative incompatibility protein HET-E-1 n=1 Tax=Colletotrichum spaethianum TaxID=700344 RepID=A0AA37P9V8_9PEZI|nr:vegetative incompatibility protein HET-E-1 [Colletotrichum spaethianum]GKT48338.1 vegetative incompatibility protein HET-E-1 [Colletotrichum spaethianum]
MSPSWWRSVKPKKRSSRQGSPQASPLPPVAPPPPASTPPQKSPASLQDRLWNQAYDELKSSESEIVKAYEKFLLTELQDGCSGTITAKNQIEVDSEKRWHQMQRLTQAGLQRTEKSASVKQKISNGMQIISPVKAVMEKAVQAAPQAAIAWVGVSFAFEILANPLTEPGINRDGISYVMLTMDWYWNLVDLLLDEKSAGPALEGLRGQLEKHIVQLYQKLLLYQMKSVCLYHRNLVAVFFRDVVKLDDWTGQLDDIKAAEGHVKSVSKQYNSEKMHKHLLDMAAIAMLQYEQLQGITSAIQDLARLQEETRHNQADKDCLKDLLQTDPRHDKTRIQDTKGGLLRDSYSWILDHPDFQLWRKEAQSRLLWIRGDPGKGKTMLVCGIIDELEKDPANKLSYFFCQATERSLDNATAVLRGLIYSLAAQYPRLISYVRDEHDSGGKQRFEGLNAWEVMSKVLETMLLDPILDGVLLIIDALDECGVDRPKLLNFIARVSSSSRANWIVSSRNWPDIEETLDSTTQKVAIRLELNEKSVSGAVHTYIQYKVDKLAALKSYDDVTRNTVQNYLIDNSNGTFLWVALVCQELASDKVRKWHTLNVIKKFPPGLESLYGRMIDHISDSNDADLCKEILATVSVIYRPVTLQELMCIMQSPTQFDNDLQFLEEIVRSCGSFLTLREGTVYFVHQSAKDFLLDEANKAFNQILPFGIAQQHHTIFLRSLEELSRKLRRDIYGLCVPGVDIEDVSPPDPDPLAPLKYSCIHWVDHLKDSNSVEATICGDMQITHTFLKYKYLYWLEALSLLRSMSQAVLAVQKLETLLASEGTQQLFELVRDACRFVLSHRSVVESYPLQIYMTALVFSPTGSLVRQNFQAEAPTWISVMPDIEANWSACLQTLEGHSDDVTSVAFSSDGQRLASGSDDHTVKVWDTATGACLQTFEGHSSRVTSVAFSSDGQRLASGSGDYTVKVWDTATGACLQTFKGHSDYVRSVAFSSDGQRFASGSDDHTVKVWDTATGACLQTFEGHSSRVTSVAFSSDGQRLASGSNDYTVKVWDTATGACLQTFKGHSDYVRSVAFSSDVQRLASGSDDRTVKVWDTATGACLQTLKGHGSWVRSVAFSSDGQRLASGSNDYTVKVWDTATGECLQTFETETVITQISFDTRNDACLSTNIGTLSLGPSVTATSSPEASSRKPFIHGYGIGFDRTWIVKDGKRFLWLPTDYRPVESDVAGSRVALGCSSGRVLWVKLLDV